LFAATVRDVAAEQLSKAAVLQWPAATQWVRPWTRWWWHGSAVDKPDLTRCLEAYHAAGLGGVEITCIYGVQGQEHRHIPYLSDQWIDVVTHTIREAHRLGMGVDLPPGSGWRIGGPGVERDDGNADIVLRSDTVAAGAIWQKRYSAPLPQAVVAYGPASEIVELTDEISSDGVLSWQAPGGSADWTVYSVGMRLNGERVKRAGPGGEGLNINPYTRRPLVRYLDQFGRRMDSLPAGGIRASFHDSFEYAGGWTDDFLKQFHERRGYRLEHHLPALDGKGNADEVARAKCDYRETISDLVLSELIDPWVAWAHTRGQLARNQAHGSPGNWLDLYAACDIPETESFGRLEGGDTRPLLFKFASSAAHVAGRRLVSSETATWLDEHFTVTLAQIKTIVDRLFLAGVNHIIYHGTAYSPADAQWPGWLFYASSQLNPQNPIWRDFPALNQYVARCQSMLQASTPDNDILVYWPIHDFWTNPRGLRENITVHNAAQWLVDTPFGRAAEWLDAEGYSFDYVSDRMLLTCRVEDDRITAPGASYAAVLVPAAIHMPAPTLEKLRSMAETGATVLFLSKLPERLPGLANEQKQKAFDEAHAAFQNAFNQTNRDEAVVASLGSGRAILSARLEGILSLANLRRESFRKEAGIQYVRRRLPGGACYFLSNQREAPFDGWVMLSSRFESAGLLDPMTGNVGVAETDNSQRVRLQLAPGESLFVRTFDAKISGEKWQYDSFAGDAQEFDHSWRIEFITGGPELPAAQSPRRLASWTQMHPPETERFAGTAAYTIDFNHPAGEAEKYALDLGDVRDSARVFLNGQEVGTCFSAPYRVVVGPLLPGKHELRVEVTNVAANRIRDLDRRGVRWRIFHDINLVNINYRPFDASNWPVRDAGLLGPITLRPLQ
jgi:hypothetical protein